MVPQVLDRRRYEDLLDNWFPLTYVLNNLNRGLGMPDGYPFVLSPPAIAKLRFVHDTIAAIGPEFACREERDRTSTHRAQ